MAALILIKFISEVSLQIKILTLKASFQNSYAEKVIWTTRLLKNSLKCF